MKKYNSIIVTGSMSWDTIMDFPSRFIDFLAPEKLHQINVSFVVDNLKKQMGGTATNIAFAASQTKKVINSLDSRLRGNDSVGVYILGGLGKDGVEHLRFFK